MERCKMLIIMFFALGCEYLGAQQQGAVNASLGISGVANHTVFSLDANPSVIHFLDSNTLGVVIHRPGFFGRSLRGGLQYSKKNRSNGLGLGLYTFGNSFYNFSQANLALSQSLAPDQALAVQFKYFREFVYRQDNAFAIAANLGYTVFLAEQISMGLGLQQVIHRSSERLEDSYSTLRSRANLGIRWEATENLSLFPEILVSETNPLKWSVGARYNTSNYALMMGVSNQDGLVNAGLSLPLSKLIFTLSYGFHQWTGSSVSSSLVYRW